VVNRHKKIDLGNKGKHRFEILKMIHDHFVKPMADYSLALKEIECGIRDTWPKLGTNQGNNVKRLCAVFHITPFQILDDLEQYEDKAIDAALERYLNFPKRNGSFE
jgi:hypothetical protein